MLVDYLVYAGNSAIVSREGIVTQEYALEGNLILLFLAKLFSFLCIILIKKQFGKKVNRSTDRRRMDKVPFFPVFTIITIITLLMEFQYAENECKQMLYILFRLEWW
ncbi:MAG: hypothetical protein ACLVGL_14640 [Waltera sp.]